MNPARLTRRRLLAGAAGAAAASLLPAPAAACPPWRWADTSSGVPYSKDPSVVHFAGHYLMFTSGRPLPGATRWRQMMAASTDLDVWSPAVEITPEGAAETTGICAGGAVVLAGKLHLFYQTYGRGAADQICHAVSTDGVRFVRNPGNPIIRPAGAWTCGRAIDAQPIVIGDQLFCYWATRDPSMQVQMIGAHSTPLAGITGLERDFAGARWYQRAGGPMLRPVLPWERKCVEAPTIIRRGDTLVMFYAGAYNNEPQQIGVAFSTDGLRWTRMSDRPFLTDGPAGTWNDCESGHPGIFHDPNTGHTWLFYQGNNDMGRTWWISKRRILWDGRTPRLG